MRVRGRVDKGCRNACGHTTEEHEAFDIGVRAGELGFDSDQYPIWWSPERVEDWQTGRSVGLLNRGK